MKTIEERVLDYANKLGIDPDTYYFDFCQQDYIAGATEQKDIDIKKAKDAFDKACGWLHNYTWYNAVVEEFIKAMEE